MAEKNRTKENHVKATRNNSNANCETALTWRGLFGACAAAVAVSLRKISARSALRNWLFIGSAAFKIASIRAALARAPAVTEAGGASCAAGDSKIAPSKTQTLSRLPLTVPFDLKKRGETSGCFA